MLTGRNHHQTGFGTITELSTGFPGYSGVWPREAASVRHTSSKKMVTAPASGASGTIRPTWDTSPIGPFNRWPSGLGFQYFYGFRGAKRVSGNRNCFAMNFRWSRARNRSRVTT